MATGASCEGCPRVAARPGSLLRGGALLSLFLLLLMFVARCAAADSAPDFIEDAYYYSGSACPSNTPPDRIDYTWTFNCSQSASACTATGAFPFGSRVSRCTDVASPPSGTAYVIQRTTFLSGGCTNAGSISMHRDGACLRDAGSTYYTYSCSGSVVTYTTYTDPLCGGSLDTHVASTFDANVCTANITYLYACYDGTGPAPTFYKPGGAPSSGAALGRLAGRGVLAGLVALGVVLATSVF